MFDEAPEGYWSEKKERKSRLLISEGLKNYSDMEGLVWTRRDFLTFLNTFGFHQSHPTLQIIYKHNHEYKWRGYEEIRQVFIDAGYENIVEYSPRNLLSLDVDEDGQLVPTYEEQAPLESDKIKYDENGNRKFDLYYVNGESYPDELNEALAKHAAEEAAEELAREEAKALEDSEIKSDPIEPEQHENTISPEEVSENISPILDMEHLNSPTLDEDFKKHQAEELEKRQAEQDKEEPKVLEESEIKSASIDPEQHESAIAPEEASENISPILDMEYLNSPTLDEDFKKHQAEEIEKIKAEKAKKDLEKEEAERLAKEEAKDLEESEIELVSIEPEQHENTAIPEEDSENISPILDMEYLNSPTLDEDFKKHQEEELKKAQSEKAKKDVEIKAAEKLATEEQANNLEEQDQEISPEESKSSSDETVESEQDNNDSKSTDQDNNLHKSEEEKLKDELEESLKNAKENSGNKAPQNTSAESTQRANSIGPGQRSLSADPHPSDAITNVLAAPFLLLGKAVRSLMVSGQSNSQAAIDFEQKRGLVSNKKDQVKKSREEVSDLLKLHEKGLNSKGQPANLEDKKENVSLARDKLESHVNRVVEASEMIADSDIPPEMRKELIDSVKGTEALIQEVDKTMGTDSSAESAKIKELLEMIKEILKSLFGKKEQEPAPSM